ncbi:kelch-like protein 12 isoform X1 [Eurytemora carolleeae]|uniref:kelch-like protein 12 isoform X1 n=1 Tax=Eurytemora carolleeae TaxID=1294199 RepID=UPI000C79487C|nr:kelch-like protein 12 isoform X1 [Eurytemora carolleeae]|eukprot:XP_023330606.1 kelch-like protein 12 isoform X1 [Eurytemora affinis]
MLNLLILSLCVVLTVYGGDASTPFFKKKLTRSTNACFKSIETENLIECKVECSTDKTCQTFNFGEGKCEFCSGSTSENYESMYSPQTQYFFTNDIDEDRKIKNATRMTAVLLGGIAGGAAVLHKQIYYCGGELTGGVSKDCFKNKEGVWVPVASMNEARHAFQMNTVGSKFLITGGFINGVSSDSMELYSGGIWTKLELKLSSGVHNHCGVTISESEVIVTGGFGDRILKTVQKIDITTGLVVSLFPLIKARTTHGCGLYNGEVYVAGGYAEPGTNHVEVLSLETWKWTAFTPMNNDRRDFSMAVLDGYLAAFGGDGSGGRRSVEIYNFTTGSWETRVLKSDHLFHATVTVPCV